MCIHDAALTFLPAPSYACLELALVGHFSILEEETRPFSPLNMHVQLSVFKNPIEYVGSTQCSQLSCLNTSMKETKQHGGGFCSAQETPFISFLKPNYPQSSDCSTTQKNTANKQQSTK